MLEGKAVRKYFTNHPEAKDIIENMEIQIKCGFDLKYEEMYRKLNIQDVRYISFEGWFGEKGVFAWYYPMGAPHYVKIG